MNCPVAHLKVILEGLLFTCTSSGPDFLKGKVQVSVQELNKVDRFYSCFGNPSLFFAVMRNDAHSTRGAAVSLQFGLLSFNSSDENDEDAEKKKLHNQLSGE